MIKNRYYVLFDFLHVILCPEYTIPLKESPIAHFAIVTKDGLFWLSIVTSSQLICDVTRTRDTSIVTSYSGDCSCTHKLAKRRFSPVNYKDEYRFLITRCKKLQSRTIPSIPDLDTIPQYIRHNLRAKREIYYTLQLPKNATSLLIQQADVFQKLSYCPLAKTTHHAVSDIENNIKCF